MRLRSFILAALAPILLVGGWALTSSSTSVQQSVIVVKPATPKVTITKAFRNYWNVQDDVVEFIRANVRQGYIDKSVSMAEDQGRQRAVVVMEKY